MWYSGFSLLAFSLSQSHTKKILQNGFHKPLEWRRHWLPQTVITGQIILSGKQGGAIKPEPNWSQSIQVRAWTMGHYACPAKVWPDRPAQGKRPTALRGPHARQSKKRRCHLGQEAPFHLRASLEQHQEKSLELPISSFQRWLEGSQDSEASLLVCHDAIVTRELIYFLQSPEAYLVTRGRGFHYGKLCCSLENNTRVVSFCFVSFCFRFLFGGGVGETFSFHRGKKVQPAAKLTASLSLGVTEIELSKYNALVC